MNAKDNSRTSFDRQAATYDFDRNGSHARTVYRPVLEKLLALNWSSLLDVGAGTGEMLRMLATARPEARYSGIDISPEMVETAGKKLGGAADLKQGDAENLPFGDNSFDIVICNDSFHHYPDPGKALSEFMRVLRLGGTLLVSDYCIVFPLRQLMNLFIRHGHDGDVHIYSKGELSGLAGGSTMTELLAAYNPLTGNLWLLVLAATLLSPAAVWKITRRRHQ